VACGSSGRGTSPPAGRQRRLAAYLVATPPPLPTEVAMLRRTLLVLGTCLLAPAAVTAQAAEARAEVTAVIARLFDGMRESDSTKVRSTFHADARLGSALVRDGVPSYRPDGVDGFVRAVGTPKEIVWDEQIRNLRVEVDGPL